MATGDFSQEQGCFGSDIEYKVKDAHVVAESQAVGAQLIIFKRLKGDGFAPTVITVDSFSRCAVNDVVVYAKNLTDYCVTASVEFSY